MKTKEQWLQERLESPASAMSAEEYNKLSLELYAKIQRDAIAECINICKEGVIAFQNLNRLSAIGCEECASNLKELLNTI